MKKSAKKQEKIEKMVVGPEHESEESLKSKAAKLMEDAALGEMIRELIEEQDAQKKKGPESLDDLRKIRQEKHEEMMDMD